MADILRALQGGYQMGAQMQADKRQRTLADLLGKAATSQGPQRQQHLGAAYGVDSGVAMQAESAFGKQEDQRAERLRERARMLVSLPPQMRSQAYASIVPELQQMGLGDGIPPEWTDELLPTVEAIATSGQASNVPAGYQEFDRLARDANLSAEDRALAARRALYLDRRPSNAAMKYEGVVGGDGRERLFALDPNSPQAQQIGGGASYGAPQGGDPFGFLAQAGAQVTSGLRSRADNERVDGVPNSYHLTDQARDILPPTDPQQAAFIRQQAHANGLEVIDEGDHWHLEPRGNAPQGGANPFVGRRPEDEEAAKEAAKRSVGLQYAGPEAQAEAERTRAVEEAKAGVEKQTKQPKARLALEQAKSRVQRVDALVDSILPRIGTTTSGWLGDKLASIEGTPAADLRKDIGTLQAIAGFDELNAMRAASPTGGALGNVTERELAFLQSVVRNIENSQSEPQLRRNLEAFREELRGSWQRIQQAYEQDFGGQEAPATNDIDGLLDLYR